MSLVFEETYNSSVTYMLNDDINLIWKTFQKYGKLLP